MKIIFVEKKAHLSSAKALQEKDPAIRVFSTSEPLVADALGLGYSMTWIADDIQKNDLDFIEEQAWKIARAWHQSTTIEPLVSYQGHNLGVLAELYVGNYIAWALRVFRGIEKLISESDTTEIGCFKQTNADRKVNGLFPDHEEMLAEKVLLILGKNIRLLDAGGSFNEPARSGQGVLLKRWARRCAALCYRLIRLTASPEAKAKLLICSGPRHIESLMPELVKRWDVLYLDESFRIAKLPLVIKNSARYYDYETLKNKLDQNALNRLSKFKAERVKNFPDFLKLVKAEKTFMLKNSNMLALLEDQMEYFFKEWVCEVTQYIETFHYFIKQERCDAVLVDEDTVTFRKALVQTAKEHGASTFQIPHGINFGDIEYDLFPVSSDYLMIGGNGIARYYQSQGIDQARLCVTGIPRYDQLSTMDVQKERWKVLSSLKLNPKDQVLLLASTAIYAMDIRRTSRQQQAGIRDFLEAMRRLPQKSLILKLHPLDSDAEATLSLIRQSGIRNIRVVKNMDAWRVLAASDLVVSFLSNIAIEALMMGRPTILLDYFDYSTSHVPFFKEEGARLCAKNTEQIYRLLEKGLSGNADFQETIEAAREWFQKEWVGPLDGRSGQRVADAIAACMEKQRN